MWFYEIAFKCNVCSQALQRRIFTGDHCFLGFLKVTKHHLAVSHQHKFVILFQACLHHRMPMELPDTWSIISKASQKDHEKRSRDLSPGSTKCNASPSKYERSKLGKSCLYILNGRQKKFKGSLQAVRLCLPLVTLCNSLWSQQDHRRKHLCDVAVVLEALFCFRGKKKNQQQTWNHKIHVGLCILTEE